MHIKQKKKQTKETLMTAWDQMQLEKKLSKSSKAEKEKGSFSD